MSYSEIGLCHVDEVTKVAKYGYKVFKVRNGILVSLNKHVAFKKGWNKDLKDYIIPS